MNLRTTVSIALIAFLPTLSYSAAAISDIGLGWAKNSINTKIFRKNSVVSNEAFQYAAYYDEAGYVVLARRELGSDNWVSKRTEFTGNILDAHNSINIALDGNGIVHMAWDHHDNPLNYAKTTAPDSMEFEMPSGMMGSEEADVTYPEFYSIANGDLIFLYRDGQSGRGNLVMNRYRKSTGEWSRIQTKLIDGEEQRNAYWQAYVSPESESIYLSWTWRETWDVSTNHDICYAVSHDGGITWERSNGKEYQLPINAEQAEYAALIPQNSELINQTSMCADANGNPYIASYWTPAGSEVPQFHVVYHDGSKWHQTQITDRKSAFSLSGGGTKKIPISRPQILAHSGESKNQAYLIFRDIETNNYPMVAICSDLNNPLWEIKPLAEIELGQWEPSYDIPLWHREKKLSLFIQNTAQGDGEHTVEIPAQTVSILDWIPPEE